MVRLIRLGLDVGGTFADLAVFRSESNELAQFKSLTTPDTVGCAASCLEKAADHFGMALKDFLAEVEVFCFGSTHALNTVLTETGSRVGILTTKGHRDAYFIAEMDRGGYHDIRTASERTFEPLVARNRIREANERIDFSGRAVVPLDDADVEEQIRYLVEEKEIDALVISFLWAHRFPEHERRAVAIARDLYPDLHVTGGSEITGTLGEFRRLTTAVINGYVGKNVEQQASGLEDYLRGAGLGVPILVMQLLGGVAPLGEVVRRPVTLLKSGPAGGTVAASTVAGQLGLTNVVCLDMGGTSLDVSRIVDGEMQLNRGFEVRKHPIAVPGVEVESIGAGGGSIAVVEQAGGLARLRVGPESAGSVPGPVCYARGGEEPTVTDANLVLGILNAEVDLGGEISLDLGAAEDAIQRRVAEPIGQSVVGAAWGIYRVVTAQMADAVEDALISNGLDPRDFSLVSAGAAGAMHATAIASRLGIETVVVPGFSPVFSAFGLMKTDIRHVYHLTDDSVQVPVDGASDTKLDEYAKYASARLREAASHPLDLLASENVPAEQREVSLFIDLRYSGQELNLGVEVPTEGVMAEDWTGADLRRVLDAWQEKYVRVYGEGAAWHEGSIEVINYRAIGTGRIPSPELEVDPEAPPFPAGPGGERKVYLGRWYDAKVYGAAELKPGATMEGPAVVEGELTTALLGPDETATMDAYGNLTITPNPDWQKAAELEAVASANR